MVGIYQILNKRNNKVYIGSSINLKQRLANHLSDLRGNRHPNIFLQRAYNIDSDSFEFSVIEECSEECLLQKEKDFIDLHKSLNQDFGYNLAANPGFGSKGCRWSEESKAKLSSTLAEQYKTGIRVCALKSQSEEAKEAISNSLREQHATGLRKHVTRKISDKNSVGILCHQNDKLYKSLTEAANDLKLSCGNICSVLKGNRKHTKNFTFEYVKEKMGGQVK